MPGLPRMAPRWSRAHGLTPNIARACLLTARRRPVSSGLISRRTIETLLCSRTPYVHNVIVCTLCSCTAYTIIGAAPD